MMWWVIVMIQRIETCFALTPAVWTQQRAEHVAVTSHSAKSTVTLHRGADAFVFPPLHLVFWPLCPFCLQLSRPVCSTSPCVRLGSSHARLSTSALSAFSSFCPFHRCEIWQSAAGATVFFFLSDINRNGSKLVFWICSSALYTQSLSLFLWASILPPCIITINKNICSPSLSFSGRSEWSGWSTPSSHLMFARHNVAFSTRCLSQRLLTTFPFASCPLLGWEEPSVNHERLAATGTSLPQAPFSVCDQLWDNCH